MKKGFTLVELLAVIVIIAVTSMIVFPTIGNIISKSKKSLHDSQILDIQKAAEKWATENSEVLDEYHVNDIYISLKSLQDSNYLEQDDIKDPISRDDMNGCVRINYDLDSQSYKYTYEEKTCSGYADEIADNEEYGYIIYEYDTSSKKFVEAVGSNRLSSLGKFIVDYYSNFEYEGETKNIIKVDGETDAGLYDIDDEYVFRGSNVSNYVTLVGDNDTNTSWRILSINKNDYSVKLIKTESIASNQWSSSDNELDFKKSNINTTLIKKYEQYSFDKIIDSDYQTGTVSNEDLPSIEGMKSLLSSEEPVSQTVGTISLLDYVNASSDEYCISNLFTINCKNNNYLNDMFGSSSTTWTLNSNGSEIWYIDSDGSLSCASPTDNKQIYPVVTISSSAYVINSDTATGDVNNPYKVK